MMRAGLVTAALLVAGSAAYGVTPRDADVLGDANDASVVAPLFRGRPVSEAEPSLRPSGNPLWSIPLGDLRTTLDRPIFSPSRRPIVPTPVIDAPPPPEAPPPPPPPPPPDEPVNLVLIGTVANGAESIAVFIDPATRNAIRLRVGEAYNGWVLREIRGRDASMEKGDRIEPLSMPRPDL